ncbi:DUF3892 domain-containing protein [Anaeromicropila herbilytica]|uniref:DUF3892 domain-containing protein n=1 Tax=Anaeromicropila herbilytica TaxID=2785025 RepID=A0A7R7ICZ4_9FIRM|nr:DUF3892 domain-containing protein [Anaeromicropila herbilytica]BCN29498.1 hypothetical protein bsdtb5_07930 [Anaeromicropila herbilytica]
MIVNNELNNNQQNNNPINGIQTNNNEQNYNIQDNNSQSNSTNNSMENRSGSTKVSRLIKHDGKVIGYELSNGQLTSKEEGVQMAKDGEIEGVIVSKRKDTEYLKGIPDGNETNNLGALSSISVKEDTIQ